MYKDKTSSKLKIVLWAMVIVICVFLVWFFITKSPATRKNANAEESIRTAVQQSALQCYVVEGAYPPDLKYLEDNYGLRVNTTDYYVIYDAYAENQLPDVRVTKRVH
ncbi:MAG: hypothetical protein IKG00_07620 [Lachnospiraceae bacterium]|nr:hypothetical protein [Lachnospiraceae bacterium]